MNDKTYNLRRKRHVWQKNRAYGWFLHKVKPLKLTSHQELVANSLLWDGYYKSSIRFMAPDQSLEELQNYARSLIVSGKINRMKPFWVNAWEWDSAMTEYNPFFSFGLKFLPIANAYLNCYSRYYGCRANLTRVMPKGHPQVMSQLWHRDHEDYRVMKVFLYLSDVDDVSGPFNYVKGSNYGNKWHSTFPLREEKPFTPRMQDEEVESVIPEKYRISFKGKAGTIIFADTMGLHKGGYCLEDERLMFMGAFMSGGHFSPQWREYNLVKNYSVPNRMAERYAIGLK